MQVQLVEDPAALLALRPEWGQLQSRAHRPRLTQSFEWVWTVWEQMAAPNQAPLVCITIRSEERLVLAWPFVIAPHHRFWRIATPMSTDGDYTEVLVEHAPGNAALIWAAWKALNERRAASLIHLPRLRSDSLLKAVLRHQRAVAITTMPIEMTVWDETPAWEDFWRSRSRGFRQPQERRKRRLADLGPVTFEVVEDAEGLQALFAWVLRRKVDWAERKQVRAGYWLRSPGYHRFFRHASSVVGGASGRLTGFALRLNGEIIAVQIGRRDPWRLEAVHCAYDPAHLRCSPGYIITEMMLRWAFEQGLELDQLFGEYAYKRHFANRQEQLEELSFACAPWGHAFHGLRDLRHDLSRLARPKSPTAAGALPEAEPAEA